MVGRNLRAVAVSGTLVLSSSCAPAPPLPPLSDPAAETLLAPVPSVGQRGKDVPWVPTPAALAEGMLDMARLSTSDFLIDLGSGDGRLVIGAAKRGVRARGIEFNPDLVAYATGEARRAGVDWRARFVQGDIFDTDLAPATVITMFLSSDINLRLRPRLLALEPGTRIITNTFDMADWQPDRVTTSAANDCGTWCTALMWIVPAQVAGQWLLNGQPMVIEQTFQFVRGTLGGAPIDDGRITGASISFVVGARRYIGTIHDDHIAGLTSDGGEWRAVRAATGT